MAVIRPPDAPVPGQQSRPGGIGEKVENTLLRFIARGLNNVKDLLAGILRFGLDTFLEGIEPFMIRAYAPLLNKVRNTAGCPPELQSLIDMSLSGESQAGAAVLSFLGSNVSGAALGSITGVLLAPMTMWANSKIRPQRPDIMTLQALLRRKAIDEPTYLATLGDLGWSDQMAGALSQITRPRPDVGTLALDAFRKSKPLSDLTDELTRRGFSPPDIDSILTVLTPIPGPGDLVRMAVREAFSGDAISRYQLHADFPGPFAEWMKKQGFSDEWARNYWAAHWELPSATMGMEMLHRGILDPQGFSLLLQVLDISPYWRPKIEQMSYSPYTRVDVRRMYQIGVISSYAELVRAYKDIGYDAEKADKLAQFTVLEYGESEKEATKTDVLQAYEIGRLSGSEAMVYLADMGYPDWVVRMYIARVDLSRSNKLASQRIASAKTLYVNGQFSKSDVYTELNRVPLPASEIERYLEEWEVPRLAKVARPTRADLRKFFLENFMSEADFRTELAGYRLSPRYIDWYVADAKRELVAKAATGQSDAQAAAAKVPLAAFKTGYDVQVAAIDVEISQLNLAIADLRISITPEMTYEQMTSVNTLIDRGLVQIKALQLQKAQLKMKYLQEKGKV